MTTLNPVEAQVEDPLDVAVIADTIQSIRLRLYPPTGEILSTLLDRLCGHVRLLLEEPLGPDDAHRYVIVRTAKKALAGVPRADQPDAGRWRYAVALATICETLLRRWMTYVQPEGDYEVRCEPDGDGYYVIDSVSGCTASRRVDGIARPARHLPADEASVLARSLNDARESRQPSQPAGRSRPPPPVWRPRGPGPLHDGSVQDARMCTTRTGGGSCDDRFEGRRSPLGAGAGRRARGRLHAVGGPDGPVGRSRLPRAARSLVAVALRRAPRRKDFPSCL